MVDKQIIVASYRDDYSFLQKHCKGIPYIVYEKSRGDPWKEEILQDSSLTMKDFVRQEGNIVYLPNIGLCSQVYLFHIVENYYDLSDINIFIAGDGLEDRRHRNNVPAYYYDMIVRFDENSPQYASIVQKSGNYPLRSHSYRYFNERFRKKWEELFKEPCPKKFRPDIDSTFMVTKKAIMKRPKSFYEKALGWIDERCYREEHWKMTYEGEVVSVMAPAKKNLKKFPHKSSKHFDFAACSFFEHCYQKMFDPNFNKCVEVP